MKQKVQNWGMIWLNMVGKVVLFKALLRTLPIYQYEATLALARIHKQMELVIRGF